ncbi:MAG: LacI family DNA-binding transcriptional regulator [Lentisphaeria bacterium]
MTLIAHQAGVSRVAVHAVLSPRPGSNIGVSQEKRAEILRVARDLGYVRNEGARSLATGRTNTIGVIVQSLKTRFFTDFFTYLDEVCYADGYSVTISSSEFNHEREARHLRTMLSRPVDGLILAQSAPARNNELLERFAAQGIPVVLLGGDDLELKFPSVAFDTAGAGELAADHFYRLGHRRVGFFHAGEVGDDSARMHRVRHSFFAQAWGRRAAPAPLALVTGDPAHGGIQAAAELAAMAPVERPTAVACGTDELAISLIYALRTAGLRVPEDLSVVGCDDIPAAADPGIALTTVKLPTDGLARQAWQLLSRRLHGKPSSKGGKHSKILVPPEWVVRATVGPAQRV